MDRHLDWIPVQNRRVSKKKSHSSPKLQATNALSEKESTRLISRISPLSLQELIRKRIYLKVSQDKADILCGFPRFTFKNIESNMLIPTEEQIQRIQSMFDISLQVESIPSLS